MIDEALMETCSKGELMDLEVARKIGDGCPYLINSFGVLRFDVYNHKLENSVLRLSSFTLNSVFIPSHTFGSSLN
jgi:hypothetical protein